MAALSAWTPLGLSNRRNGDAMIIFYPGRPRQSSSRQATTLYSKHAKLRRVIAPRWHVIPHPPLGRRSGDRLVPQARAGDVAGTLLIDSWMITLLRVKSGGLEAVTKTRLAPGRRLSLAILAMPESGSTYPVQLIFGAPTL